MSITINNVVYVYDTNTLIATVSYGISETEEPLILNGTINIGPDTYTVTSISAGAFSAQLWSGQVVIPNTITTIGQGAFDSCNYITGVTFGNALTTIEDFAFFACYALVGQINIPNSVTTIGQGAFQECTGITGLTLGNSVVTINTDAFNNCSGITELIIPNSVVNMGDNAFNNCGITGPLTIPSSVTYIGAFCFGNVNLLNVIIEDQNVCSVSINAFKNVSTTEGTSITYYSTASQNDLTSNWATVNNNFETQIYNANPVCFNEGTKILCLNDRKEDEYIAIERLRKGDFVKSYKHGYRKINEIRKNKMTNYPNLQLNSMYVMKKTKNNGLIEDLIVTGGHSILVDDLGEYLKDTLKIFGEKQKIDDKYLLLASISKDFTKLNDYNEYIYYHFVLENDGNDDERYGVWANGILTETPSMNYFLSHF